ncbi:signal peptidase I [Microbacterium sp. zg-Y818]|uniref:signal peptidase I n=1 Tax=unclassified Microbacterium TaxID=2609290 RepID=UPI00214C9E6E|nr:MULTISPECIES: signal peptidase I [unclassified Microbacterium]MCR2800380.1 signal peptidase I [Microbacterium sp. zg.Y818]WIM22340.1 signal peptidase I [Microbacterium sp. zg-Y818]
MTAITHSIPLPGLTSRRALRAAGHHEHSLLHYLAVALSASLLTITAALAVAVIMLPALVGGTAMTVLTQSMEPGLPPGTLIVTRATPTDEIAVGDVITYQIRSGEAAVVTHRVISKTYTDGELTFVTQGDNNNTPDPEPVREVQIRGTLWYSVPLLGWVNNLINGANRDIVISVAAGGLFLYALRTSILAGLERRRERAEAASEH